jgi:hypothetical protein
MSGADTGAVKARATIAILNMGSLPQRPAEGPFYRLSGSLSARVASA